MDQMSHTFQIDLHPPESLDWQGSYRRLPVQVEVSIPIPNFPLCCLVHIPGLHFC